MTTVNMKGEEPQISNDAYGKANIGQLYPSAETL